MRPCPMCNAPNPEDKTTCYACRQSLTMPPQTASQPLPPTGHSYPPQQPYPPQQYPQQYPPQPYAPQAYPPPYPQSYAPQQPPGVYPQQMAAAPPNFNPSEVVRAAQIKKEYRAITARLLLAVLVTIVAGSAIAYSLKGHQTVLGIPTMFWCCAPVLGMMAFAVAICRCPGCKASLMMRNDVNETGQCPFCRAQLK